MAQIKSMLDASSDESSLGGSFSGRHVDVSTGSLTNEDATELIEMLSNAPAMIYSFTVDENNENARFPFCSKGAGHVFGVSAEAIMEDSSALIGAIKPDDTESFIKSVAQSWKNLTEWNWTGRFRAPDHEDGWRCVKCNSMPKRLPNGHTIWYGATFDVNAHIRLAASEEKLSASTLEKKMLQVQCCPYASASARYTRRSPLPKASRVLDSGPAPPHLSRSETRPWDSSMRTRSTC